uniref:Carrier domain-containing protein n=1 Tax=Steinernema glaseri TaxID=37863 RepID=A0A1I7Z459_9BILA
MVEEGDISIHQGFFELGLDSMMLIDFINRLNTVFQEIKLNTNDLFNYPNIEELGKAIHAR